MNAVQRVGSGHPGQKRTQANVQSTGETAFRLMQEHRILLTPTNYQICFDYVRGENTALCEELTALLAAKGGPAQGLMAQIFEKYFGESEESSAVHQTNVRVQGEIERVLDNLRRAESDTHKFGNVLEGYSGSFEAVTDISTVRQLITGLSDEARSMKEKSRTLEGQLQKSSEEIDKLKRNLEAVRAEAATDDLTGIGNRKHFERTLAHHAAVAQHDNTPLSLILGDVDHFKHFNDTWGHQLGDQVL
ncbi:MAG: GGDEF domain-containing protein, partial [Sphingomonadales bacterium]